MLVKNFDKQVLMSLLSVDDSGERKIFADNSLFEKRPKLTLNTSRSMRDPKICADLDESRASCRCKVPTQFHQGVATDRWRNPNNMLFSDVVDSAQDNILSGKVSKKIHEADNCELHEVQQKTDKVQDQRCYPFIKAGFQVYS